MRLVIGNWYELVKDFITKAELRRVFEIATRSDNDQFISLNFVSNHEIKRLNRLSRWINKATDCLSFPYWEDWVEIGDIFIAFPFIKDQAKANKRDLKDEIIYIFIHCLLHIFWYDHVEDSDFEIMESAQSKILSQVYVWDKGRIC